MFVTFFECVCGLGRYWEFLFWRFLQYFFKVTEAVAESVVVKQSAISSAAQQNIHNNGEFSTHRYSAGQKKREKL